MHTAEVYDLGGLASGNRVAWQEVWPVERWVAWANSAPAVIAAYYATPAEALGVGVECCANRHVLEGLAAHRLREVEGDGGHLGDLASGDVVAWAEVGHIGRRHAWFRIVALVADDDAVVVGGFDETVEGVELVHVLEVGSAYCVDGEAGP